VTSIQAYNYVTNTWTTKSSRFERTYLNGVGVIGGKLYLAGGAVEKPEGVYTYERGLYVYDPVADRLTRKADLVPAFSPRHAVSGAGLPSGL
jgi:hypothetical protein